MRKILIVLFLLGSILIKAQDPVIVWSENWDDATSFNTGWSETHGWIDEGDISLVSMSGHGKVVDVLHPSGSHNTQSGFGNYHCFFDSSYTEIYVSFDYYLPGFDWSDGNKGKFFAGGGGGSLFWVPKELETAYDTTGWGSILMWDVGHVFHWYNYFDNYYYPDGGVYIIKNLDTIVGASQGQTRISFNEQYPAA